MLLPLALAFQLAGAVPAPLSVRVGERVRAVPTVRVAAGNAVAAGAAAVRADQLLAALGGAFADDGADRILIQLGELRLSLREDAAFIVSGTDTVPMASAAFRRDARVYVPLTFATQLLPRLSTTLRYDATKRELRRLVTPTVAKNDAPSRPDVSPSPVRPAERSPNEVRQRVVVVDAGHGGPDNGMTGPIGATRKVREKDITLAIAKALRESLQARGVRVVMTRTTDTLIALRDRGRIANRAKGDLFLSVHVNAANPRWNNPGSARGFETYFLAEAKTEDEKRVEAMENESIRFETNADATSDDPLGFIIRDMAQNEHLRESSRLADLMQGGLRQVHPGTNRGVKQAGFSVLVTAFMPAVLVEIGFGSNRLDSAFMTDPAKQRVLAESLASAAVTYLEQYERKVGGTP